MTEKELLAAVRQVAQLTGWRVYHTHDSRRSEAGFPDLVLVRDRVLYRELKTARGRTTPEQDAWLEALRATGADADVWRPQDLTDGTVAFQLQRGQWPASPSFAAETERRVRLARQRRALLANKGRRLAPPGA